MFTELEIIYFCYFLENSDWNFSYFYNRKFNIDFLVYVEVQDY